MFLYVSFFLCLFITILPSFPSRNMPDFVTILPVNPDINYTWSTFHKWFIDICRGSEIISMFELKKYFHRFRYLPKSDTNFTDIFDDGLESAVTQYQSKLGLHITGKLVSCLDQAKKVDLRLDDVNGVQVLYGSNPNFSLTSFLQFETSPNKSFGLRGHRLNPIFSISPIVLAVFFLYIIDDVQLFYYCNFLICIFKSYYD
ncbi:hypothetical protein MKX01_017489 [Papaver californicum]|nr:hypothetical protein MKX01_017489 [Papaver californicum]